MCQQLAEVQKGKAGKAEEKGKGGRGRRQKTEDEGKRKEDT